MSVFPIAPHPQQCFTQKMMFGDRHRTVISYVHTEFPLGSHCHDFYEINVVLAGHGIHYINGIPCEAPLGSVFVIPPKVLHGYHASDDLQVWHLLLHRDFFEMQVQSLSSLPCFVSFFEIEPSVRDKELFLCLDEAQRAELGRQTTYLPPCEYTLSKTDAYLAQTQALLVLSLLLKWYAVYHPHSDRPRTKKNARLLEVMSHIRLHYAEHLTLSELQARSGFASRSSFLRGFFALCGKTPMQYLQTARLQAAAGLLRQGELSVTEVAYRCGFYDASQFARYFRAAYGLSPKEYKHQRQAK